MVTPAADPQPEAYAAVIPMGAPIGANALQPTKRKGWFHFSSCRFLARPAVAVVLPHTPLAVTPEPGTLLLFSSGLAGVFWKLRKSGRKR